MTRNALLEQLRDTARLLQQPQAAVAANWLRAGIAGKPYSASRNVGISRADYATAQRIIRRLASLPR